MVKVLSKIAISIILMLNFAFEVYCLYIPVTLQESWDNSVLIFSGKVTNVKKPNNLQDVFRREYNIYEFEISNIYKGKALIVSKNIAILGDNLLYDDYIFEKDSNYLVYTTIRNGCRFFQVDRESRTGFVNDRERDILFLRECKDTITNYVSYLEYKNELSHSIQTRSRRCNLNKYIIYINIILLITIYIVLKWRIRL